MAKDRPLCAVQRGAQLQERRKERKMTLAFVYGQSGSAWHTGAPLFNAQQPSHHLSHYTVQKLQHSSGATKQFKSYYTVQELLNSSEATTQFRNFTHLG